MQTAAVFVAILAAASANSIAFRVPSADSAVINSHQQGGNFAYSTQEAQAFGVVSPVVSQVATPVQTTYSVQQPAAVTYTAAAVQQPAVTYTAAVQQPLQQVVSVQQPLTYTVQQKINQVADIKPVQQQLTYTVQPNVEVKNLPVASTYVASAPAWNQWYGNAIAPVQYAVVDAKKVQTVEQKPVVQYGYSIQQGGAATVVSAPLVSSQVVAPVTTYTAASVVEKGTPADTYKTVAGVSPLGFNNVYGIGQPWANQVGYQVVV